MKNGDYQWRLSGVHDIGQSGLYGKNEKTDIGNWVYSTAVFK